MDAPGIITSRGDEKPSTAQRSPDRERVAAVLQGYLREAKEARESGLNPRDAKWRETLDLYWNRYNFSDKADWQSKETTPTVPAFVDRFAAALKEAYGVAAEGMYTIIDPADPNNDLSEPIKNMTDVWFSTSGSNASGQPTGFEAVFEDQMKLGALMATSSIVTWKKDTAYGRVAIEGLDPRNVWLDHTGRGLYRARLIEIDRHKLPGLVRGKNGKLFNADEILAQTQEFVDDMRDEKERLTGHGQEITSSRHPVILHEFYGDIVEADGTVLAENALTVMSGEKFIIRGPEPNPFWHGRDWVTYAPLITVPMSPYGRAYGEDFGSTAETFNKITNLILDAVQFSSIKAFVTIPDMLQNPAQLNEGIKQGQIFKLQYGVGTAAEFIKEVELGTLSADTVQVWQMLKNELTEAARVNEIGLGQFAPNSRTSATEISETSSSSSALIRSVAQTVETRWFEPQANLVWKTGLQHARMDDPALRAAAGPEMYKALLQHRKELIKRPLTFQARGISNLIAKSAKLRSLVQVLQIVAGNEILLQQFLQVVDLEKLVNLLFDLANLDIRRIKRTQREQIVQQFGQAMGAQGQQGGSPPKPAQDVANLLGVSRA